MSIVNVLYQFYKSRCFIFAYNINNAFIEVKNYVSKVINNYFLSLKRKSRSFLFFQKRVKKIIFCYFVFEFMEF